MRKFDTISLLRHARNGLNSGIQQLEDSGESVLSCVVLNLRYDTMEVEPKMLDHVNRLIEFSREPEKWNSSKTVKATGEE